MKRVLWIFLLISGYGIRPLQAQTTASFNFSAAAQPVAGWINVAGDPSLAVRTATDVASGISISSIATTNWVQFNAACAWDGGGAPGGTFFPAAVMLNYWYQYSSLANYNAAVPQFRISGLNKDSVYTIKIAGSSISTLISDPTRYTVAGLTVAGYIDVNNHNNTANGAAFYNVSPDSAGAIRVYANTLPGTDVANVCGIQIIRGRVAVPLPMISFTSPRNTAILPEGTNVLFSATASVTGGSIAKVQFFRDTFKIAEVLTAPYTYTWVNPDPGNYILTAKAIDNRGGSASATIRIMIQSLNYFWSTTGNIATGGDTNFVGTVDTNRLAFRTNNQERMSILGDGTIGIGTKNTQGYKLAVNGTAIFTKVRIKPYANWPDYVFKKGYALPDLTKLEQYITRYRHLPGIVSEAAVKTEGLDIGDHQAGLLKKVEELTLYLIEENKKWKEQNKRLEEQSQQLNLQNARLEKQQQQIDALKKLIHSNN